MAVCPHLCEQIVVKDKSHEKTKKQRQQMNGRRSRTVDDDDDNNSDNDIEHRNSEKIEEEKITTTTTTSNMTKTMVVVETKETQKQRFKWKKIVMFYRYIQLDLLDSYSLCTFNRIPRKKSE